MHSLIKNRNNYQTFPLQHALLCDLLRSSINEFHDVCAESRIDPRLASFITDLESSFIFKDEQDSISLPKETLAGFSEHNKDLEKILQNKEECSICIEELFESQAIVKLDCNHVFHMKCVCTAFNTMLHQTCPLCRKDQRFGSSYWGALKETPQSSDVEEGSLANINETYRVRIRTSVSGMEFENRNSVDYTSPSSSSLLRRLNIQPRFTTNNRPAITRNGDSTRPTQAALHLNMVLDWGHATANRIIAVAVPRIRRSSLSDFDTANLNFSSSVNNTDYNTPNEDIARSIQSFVARVNGLDIAGSPRRGNTHAPRNRAIERMDIQYSYTSSYGNSNDSDIFQ